MSSTHLAAALAAIAILPLLSVGCMSDMAYDGADDTAGALDSGWGPPDSDDDTGDEDQLDPTWWSLAVTSLMEEGSPVQGDTSLVISLIDESADPGSPICQATYDQPALTVLDVPDPSIYHWWQVELGEPTTDCSTHQLTWIPLLLELGVGSLHPDIAALLEPSGYAEVEPYLYGAYLRSGKSQTIWTYGIAATAAGFAGDQAPVSEPPIPDGTYSLVPIYLLPLQGG